MVQIPLPAGGGKNVLFHSSDIIIGHISPSKDSDIGSLPRRIFLCSWHWDLLFFNRLQQYTLHLTHSNHSQDTWSQNHVWKVEKEEAVTNCVLVIHREIGSLFSYYTDGRAFYLVKWNCNYSGKTYHPFPESACEKMLAGWQTMLNFLSKIESSSVCL